MVDSKGAGDDGGKWWIETMHVVEMVFKWWKCQAFSFVDVEEETRR